jgi:2'-5' RNA ligase
MRLFAGIDLPSDVVRNLSRLVDTLRPKAKIKWSPPQNLHITTKFIGEWPEDRLEELTAALSELPAREPINIAVRGLGWFPNPHAPRVFWAAVKAGAELAALARETEDALARLGVAKEPRGFSPHLTLARIKEPVALAGLRQAVAALDSDEFGAFTADRFFLYRSEREPGGSVYTKLAEYPFSKS